MYLTDAASSERLGAAQNKENEYGLEEKLKHARSHEEEICLLMEYRRQAPKTNRNSKESL
jgi:hypothetical protein